jgi:hypothetical protein
MLILRAGNLAAPNLSHGFFGRPGGVSTGVYAGLNCGPGSGDAREAVMENRRRATAALEGAQLCTLYQIHSNNVVIVTEPWQTAPQADALVTRLPGLALGVLTADCAPVLLADAVAGVVGAAHAGWKGALLGVTDSAVAVMEELGAVRARIAAAVGPCIGQASYEVDAAFRDRFLVDATANATFFVPGERENRFRFDLESYVVMRLKRAGIGSVERISADTYARETDFYSYRRATHRSEPDYGRELSAIVLTP